MDPTSIATADGETLEAQLARPDGPVRAAAVLCHPLPTHGGTMRSIVVGKWFKELPRTGIVCLRFNFRGVGQSTGHFDEGAGERRDAEAALRHLRRTVTPDVPLVMAGWSFGADVALSVTDPEIAGWVAVTPPRRWTGPGTAAADPRPKLVVFGDNDELVPSDAGVEDVSSWPATEVVVVPGADHFFVGRTDHVIEATERFVDGLVRP